MTVSLSCVLDEFIRQATCRSASVPAPGKPVRNTEQADQHTKHGTKEHLTDAGIFQHTEKIRTPGAATSRPGVESSASKQKTPP
jgi:hypothetical protein